MKMACPNCKTDMKEKVVTKGQIEDAMKELPNPYVERVKRDLAAQPESRWFDCPQCGQSSGPW